MQIKPAYVDGRKKMLPNPEIIMGSLTVHTPDKEPSDEEQNGLFAAALSPDQQMVQIYNTVFAFNAKQKNEDVVALTRIFNVDTPKNFAKNILEFIGVAQRREITLILAPIPTYTRADLTIVNNAVHEVDKTAKKLGLDVKIDLGRSKNGLFMFYAKPGTKPILETMGLL